MALKPNRHILESDITLVCNDAHETGTVLVYSTSMSGVGVYNPGIVTVAANSSGKIPAGVSLSNFVNIDQTRQKRNFQRDEQVIGEKAPLVRKGWVVTDRIASGVSASIDAGVTAYVGANGLLTPTASTNPKIGQFAGKVDADGFVKVYVNLPVV
jgi:hypothetical protein